MARFLARVDRVDVDRVDLDAALRVRALLVVLRAVFVAPLTLRLRDFELRELADFVLEPLDLVLLDATPALPVVDLILADLTLLDTLAVLPEVLAFLPAILPTLALATFLEADEVERLFLLLLPSLPPLPLVLRLASPSLPNSLVM